VFSSTRYSPPSLLSFGCRVHCGGPLPAFLLLGLQVRVQTCVLCVTFWFFDYIASLQKKRMRFFFDDPGSPFSPRPRPMGFPQGLRFCGWVFFFCSAVSSGNIALVPFVSGCPLYLIVLPPVSSPPLQPGFNLFHVGESPVPCLTITFFFPGCRRNPPKSQSLVY